MATTFDVLVVPGGEDAYVTYVAAGVYFHPPSYGKVQPPIERIAFYHQSAVERDVALILDALWDVPASGSVDAATLSRIGSHGHDPAAVCARLRGWHNTFRHEKGHLVDTANVYLLSRESDSRTIKLKSRLRRPRGSSAAAPQGRIGARLDRLQAARSYEEWRRDR